MTVNIKIVPAGSRRTGNASEVELMVSIVHSIIID